jgi:hypothetical protein
MQNVIRTSRRLDSFLHEAAQNFEVFSNIQECNKKIKKLKRLMSFSRLIHLSNVDPMWPDDTLKDHNNLLHLFPKEFNGVKISSLS